MNIVTLSDNKYLRQGELLYESLLEHNPHFVMHYLCLDEQTLNVMTKKNRCKAYAYEEIESNILKNHRRTHTWEQHCWALASYFMNWLRKRGVGDMMYIDADIYFYRPVSEIPINNSIGIIEHRFKKYDPNRKVGHYNVGVIYFADDKPGTDCLNLWSNWVLNDGNEFYEDYGSCGDQKYLELFERFYPNDTEVLDFGHAAPWNTHQDYKRGQIGDYPLRFIKFKEWQVLIFYHFSHFKVTDSGYVTNRNGEWLPENTWAKELYDDYYKLIKL